VKEDLRVLSPRRSGVQPVLEGKISMTLSQTLPNHLPVPLPRFQVVLPVAQAKIGQPCAQVKSCFPMIGEMAHRFRCCFSFLFSSVSAFFADGF
jgi:hypothetical protein